ncbi:MAG TPA: hypothetical protein VHV83_20600, partial [Armatimonadota bacterium]|nr:hypothetical protein [Armatimonadota bacterium]
PGILTPNNQRCTFPSYEVEESDLTTWSWKDPCVTADNGTAHILDPNGRNARIVQTVTVHPFRQYHISVRVKTDNFIGTPEIKVLANGKSLTFQRVNIRSTQDWTMQHITFNSLENQQVTIYFGCWDGRTGSLWFDDAQLDEVGFLNLVRREGAPLIVRREDTGTVLQEGTDYAPIRDLRMGRVPWPGSYEVWHEPPTIKTNLPDGTRLRVSFYHAVVMDYGQVTVCPSEPKTIAVLRDEISRVHQLWGANAYFMSHDEIRVLNWDDSCTRRNLDAGAILADNVKTCTQLIRDINPHARIFVWSDMFDPFHNAHSNYYLVRGDLTGSWEGIDHDVIIGMWNYGNREKSLKFFAERGNHMLIAGYYDANPTQTRNWLDAAKAVPGVTGMMYTTWRNNYTDLESFQQGINDYLAEK